MTRTHRIEMHWEQVRAAALSGSRGRRPHLRLFWRAVERPHVVVDAA